MTDSRPLNTPAKKGIFKRIIRKKSNAFLQNLRHKNKPQHIFFLFFFSLIQKVAELLQNLFCSNSASNAATLKKKFQPLITQVRRDRCTCTTPPKSQTSAAFVLDTFFFFFSISTRLSSMMWLCCEVHIISRVIGQDAEQN